MRDKKWGIVGWWNDGIRMRSEGLWDDENGVENGSIYRYCSTLITTVTGTVTAITSD